MTPQLQTNTQKQLFAAVNHYLQEMAAYYQKAPFDDDTTTADSDIDILAGAKHITTQEAQEPPIALRFAHIAAALDDELKRVEFLQAVRITLAGSEGDIFDLAGAIAPTLITLAASEKVDIAPKPFDIALASLVIGRLAKTNSHLYSKQ